DAEVVVPLLGEAAVAGGHGQEGAAVVRPVAGEAEVVVLAGTHGPGQVPLLVERAVACEHRNAVAGGGHPLARQVLRVVDVAHVDAFGTGDDRAGPRDQTVHPVEGLIAGSTGPDHQVAVR